VASIGKRKRNRGLLWENLKERDSLENLDIVGRIIVNDISKE
jgi:hypothetical protein